MKKTPCFFRIRCGFTLLELLVAISILTVLLVSLASIIGNVSERWKSTVARVDNISKARVSLDVIGSDLAKSLISPNLPAFPVSGGKSQMRFITRTPSAGDRALSLVQYRVLTEAEATTPEEIGLWRDSVPVDYTQPLPWFSGTLALPTTMQENQLGPGIMLFRFQFVQNDGTLRDDFQFDFDAPTAPTSCRSAVVTLLVVNETALAQLEATGKVSSFIQHFTDPAAPTRFRDHWMTLRDDPTFNATMPEAVRSGIEIYERSYPLHPSL